MNHFTQRLGLALPLIQAPMAGVQGSALALAVGRAGALGSLPCAMLAPEVLRTELQALRASGLPYNVNFFCHTPPTPDAARDAAWRAALAPFYEEFGLNVAEIPAGPGRRPFDAGADALLAEFQPPVVSFHFGLPAPELLAQVKRRGAFVLASATSVREARWLEAHGADAVIAQGLEAGGHRGHFLPAAGTEAAGDDAVGLHLSEQMGTFALLPQVVAAVRVPVIAAGGIADAAGVRAAMALGAAAVQVGTAFLCTDEATTTPLHRAALQSDAAGHTALTNVFTGRPARGIVNRAIRELGAAGAALPAQAHARLGLSEVAPAFPLATAGIAPLRAAAEKAGSAEFSPLWSGQNASACRSEPAARTVARLAAGFAA